jgi:hypothetical protein
MLLNQIPLITDASYLTYIAFHGNSQCQGLTGPCAQCEQVRFKLTMTSSLSIGSNKSPLVIRIT